MVPWMFLTLSITLQKQNTLVNIKHVMKIATFCFQLKNIFAWSYEVKKFWNIRQCLDISDNNILVIVHNMCCSVVQNVLEEELIWFDSLKNTFW